MTWFSRCVNEVRIALGFALLVGSALAAYPACAGEEPALVVEAKIALGDIAGRIDHLAYDPARKRLYIAELGNDSIGIVDLSNGRLLRTVTGFDEPQGIGYEPSTDTVYVANGGDGSLRLFRGTDFTPIRAIALGADADNVRVDRAARRVYVGYGNGAIAVVDAVSRKRIAAIPLKGHPEGFQLEAKGPRIFVNVPDASVIQVVSRDSETSIASWPTGDLNANFPMAIDASYHRLLVAFRRPARLEAFDEATGDRQGGVDICGDADDVFVDTKRDRVYVICGQGLVDTYGMAGKRFTRLGPTAIAGGSRTGLFLLEVDRLAVAIRASHAEPAAIWVFRPTP